MVLCGLAEHITIYIIVSRNTQVLDEFSAKNGWGSPIYQLHSTIGRDGSGDLQLFLFKVRCGLHCVDRQKIDKHLAALNNVYIVDTVSIIVEKCLLQIFLIFC